MAEPVYTLEDYKKDYKLGKSTTKPRALEKRLAQFVDFDQPPCTVSVELPERIKQGAKTACYTVIIYRDESNDELFHRIRCPIQQMSAMLENGSSWMKICDILYMKL